MSQVEHADHFLSIKGIMRVSFPLMIGSGIGAVQQCMDRLFLSYLSADALAASFPPMITHYTICCFFIAAALYVGTFVSQHYGAKEFDQVGASTWPGLLLSVIGALIALAMVPLLPTVFSWFAASPVITQYMIELCTWYCFATLPTVLMAVWSAFFSSIGRTRLVMVLSVTAVLLNVGFNYICIFGALGVPAMGVVGAAIGTFVAQTVVMLIYAGLFFARGNRQAYDIMPQWKSAFTRMPRFLKFAAPHGVREIIEVGSWHFLFISASHLGTVALAASNIAIGWYFMFFAPLIGILQSSSIGVGHLVGANRYDDVPQVFKLHLIISLSYAGIWLFLFIIAGPLFILPFIGDDGDVEQWKAIEEITYSILIIGGFWGGLDALQLLLRSVINAAGDVWWTFIATPIIYLLALVLPCYLLINYAEEGHDTLFGIPLLMIVWFIACFSLTVLSVVFYYRYRSGQWRLASVRQ